MKITVEQLKKLIREQINSDAQSKYEDWMETQQGGGLIRAKRALLNAKSELTKAFEDSIAHIRSDMALGHGSSQDVEDVEAAYKEAVKSIDIAIAKIREVKDIESFILDT